MSGPPEQLRLVDLEVPADVTPSAADEVLCPKIETASVSHVRDRRRLASIDNLARRLREATEPIDQARFASQLRDAAERIFAEAVAEAHSAGLTWREVGEKLGVPFQTLHRRYGLDRQEASTRGRQR